MDGGVEVLGACLDNLQMRYQLRSASFLLDQILFADRLLTSADDDDDEDLALSRQSCLDCPRDDVLLCV